MLSRNIIFFIKDRLPVGMRTTQDIYFVVFVISALAFIIPTCPWFFALGQERAGISVAVVAVLVFLTLLAWRFFKLPLMWAQNIYQSNLLAVILYNAWYMGGLSSPVLVWLGVVPVLPLFTARSRVWVYIWMILSFSSVLGFYVIQTQGILPMQPHETVEDLAFRALMYAMLLITQLSLINSVDMLSESTLRHISRTNTRLNLLSIDLQKANAHKDQFLAMVSHEMRTPLNAVMGYLSLMSTDKRLPEDAVDFVKGAQNSAAHLLTVINDLLDYSQIQNGRVVLNPQVFNLHVMLHKTHSIFKPRANDLGLNYKLVISPTLPEWVRGDQHRLAQILINLLGNALKFTDKGHVTTQVDYEPTARNEGDLVIRVKDSGRGIPVEAQHKIFDPFVQLSQADGQAAPRDALRGNGLGLSITRTLVTSHGGTIGLHSEVGVGSEFRVDIPLPVAPAPPKSVPALELIDHSAVKLLIVDDHAVNRMVATATIQRSMPNAQIDQAENGTEGLEKMSTTLYDLVLLDLVMPDIDGIEVMRRVRGTLAPPYRDVQVVALTANVAEEALKTCLAVGISEVMPKPFDRLTLVNTVIRHCSKPTVGEPPANPS
ncbi:MAG: response regulator [Betaproteobacteria bacterium]|nr:response regulator [Betaproteobacteria bacterium]